MSDLTLTLGGFHFIRPLILLALPFITLLWWTVRRSATRDRLPDTGMAPHLRAALTVGADSHHRLRPIDGVALGLVLTTLGAAGPTWTRVPDPFVGQSAPAVVILKVTPSMENGDVAPTRLERGKQKIRDFLNLRAGARTALVAFAGTAHAVVPMTEDPGVVLPYLEGLTPEVMPREGNALEDALALARQTLARENLPGGILIVADSLDPDDVAALQEADTAVALLSMLPEGTRDRGTDQFSGPVIQVTPDSDDVHRIDRLLNSSYRQALLEDGEQPWDDRAHWLAWPFGLLLLLWFRRGWTMHWALVASLGIGLAMPQQARADGLADWFLTPDQQGQIAFERKDYRTAAESFTDPLWRGYALYKDGQYEAAADVLGRVETAQAAVIQGMAQIKSRAYRDAVRSFETALQRDSNYPGAAQNLVTAREIVEFVETTREQSDTGEESGIGADEEVFDNEADRGAETERQAPAGTAGDGPLTTEQWMNTVDTRTGQFLRQRFALEAARSNGTPVQEASEPRTQGGSE